jgi:hypothetical protein
MHLHINPLPTYVHKTFVLKKQQELFRYEFKGSFN